MRYLYGDSTPSPLQSNFLAFLRDAIRFGVHLLHAQERIEGLHADGRAADQAAEAERTRIAGLKTLVFEAAESANTNGPDSASQRAVDRVTAAAEQSIAATLAEIATKLAAEHAALDALERSERDACLQQVGELLAGHEPHEGTWGVELQVNGTGYSGETRATTPYGFAWTCALEFGEGHPMVKHLRVGDLISQMELSLPEPGGFLKKGKVKAQRVDAYFIDSFSANAREAKFTLRQISSGPVGLDIAFSGDSVQMTRAGVKDHAECEVSSDDAQKLLSLRDKLLHNVTACEGLVRRALEAYIDDEPLADRPDLIAVVERLIGVTARVTNEIQAHSRTPDELVIRRLLGNDRREEVFVTTASLLEKLSPLSEDQRSVFAPLKLARVRRAPPPEEVDDDEPVVRTRIRAVTPVALPIHQPTPPPAPEPAPATSVEEPAPVEPEKPVEKAVEKPAEKPVEAAPDPGASGVISVPDRDSSPVIPPSGDGAVVVDATTKDALAATVKRIVGSARAGRTTEAYEAYAALFEDPDFAQQRPQDQRQVLKLMVNAKAIPPQTSMVIEAYRSALSRLKALANEAADPIDKDLIGACETALKRPAVD